MFTFVDGNQEFDIGTDLVLRFEVPEPQIIMESGMIHLSIEGWGSSSNPGEYVFP